MLLYTEHFCVIKRSYGALCLSFVYIYPRFQTEPVYLIVSLMLAIEKFMKI